jgi:hypothetical protein
MQCCNSWDSRWDEMEGNVTGVNNGWNRENKRRLVQQPINALAVSTSTPPIRTSTLPVSSFASALKYRPPLYTAKAALSGHENWRFRVVEKYIDYGFSLDQRSGGNLLKSCRCFR